MIDFFYGLHNCLAEAFQREKAAGIIVALKRMHPAGAAVCRSGHGDERQRRGERHPRNQPVAKQPLTVPWEDRGKAICMAQSYCMTMGSGKIMPNMPQLTAARNDDPVLVS